MPLNEIRNIHRVRVPRGEARRRAARAKSSSRFEVAACRPRPHARRAQQREGVAAKAVVAPKEKSRAQSRHMMAPVLCAIFCHGNGAPREQKLMLRHGEDRRSKP